MELTEPPTLKIRVEVETSYIEEQSDPRDKRFVFSYTITIRNEGQVPARLLTRHWIITDANGNVKETRGDGVVGEQPYLKPGQGFRYSSGAVIETPVGTMQGSYQMIADDGQHFDAPIAPFRLRRGACALVAKSAASAAAADGGGLSRRFGARADEPTAARKLDADRLSNSLGLPWGRRCASGAVDRPGSLPPTRPAVTARTQ